MSSLIYKQISQGSSAPSHVSDGSVQSWTLSLHHIQSPGGNPMMKYTLERHLVMYTSNNSSQELTEAVEENWNSFSSLIILFKKKKYSTIHLRSLPDRTIKIHVFF